MQKDKKGIKNWIQQGSYDMPFFIIVLVLLTIGLIMLYSASYVSASYTKGKPEYFFVRQLAFGAAGVIAMLLVSRVRVSVLKKFAYVFAIVYVVLLILVLLMPAKIENKEDFRRWLDLPLLPQFQPSELAKFGLILFCSRVLASRKKLAEKLRGHDLAIPICVLMIALTCALVVAENHLSCTILLFGIGAVMLVPVSYTHLRAHET